jgi:hypothetical protein
MNTKQPATTPAIELYKLLLKSEKFVNWNPNHARTTQADLSTKQMAEQHYAPQELADLWGVSVQTIREVFKDEEGVLKLGSDGNRNRRAYKTLRIPKSIAERVHTRLSA